MNLGRPNDGAEALGPLIIVDVVVTVRRATYRNIFLCAEANRVLESAFGSDDACISPRYNRASANSRITAEARHNIFSSQSPPGRRVNPRAAISKVETASKGCDSNPNSKVAAWLEVEPMKINPTKKSGDGTNFFRVPARARATGKSRGRKAGEQAIL